MSDLTPKLRSRLSELVLPGSAALLTMELQRGVVGPTALLPALVDQVRDADMLGTIGSLCERAREIGVRVVHCTAEGRPDGAGGTANCRILARGAKLRAAGEGQPIGEGSDGAKLVVELGPDPRDIIMSRLHGMSPFTSTSLDQVLRNMGTTTIVVTGVSVNIGIMGLVISGVDLGYQVVVVRDGVVGVPASYTEQVMEHTFANLTTIVSSDDLFDVWSEFD